jgi:dienelactone hydrolase
MTSETIGYTEGDDSFDAFIARPDATGDRPAVLICHAWSGRKEFEERKAAQLAELGYVGAAIDLYGVGKRGTDLASNQALMKTLTDNPPRLRRRLTAAYQAVRTLDGVDPDRMGVIGFCFGGLCAILAARMGLPLRGAVSFHGLLKIGERLDARVRAKILVEHGQDDPMVPPADLAAFAEEMKRIGADWQLHAYPGVVHAFTNPAANDPSFGTVYDADADRRSWIDMTRFFADVFGSSGPGDE